ncbi:response regulator [Sphingobium sp. B11D3D]|uniref:response regulator n=1 Tax=Sphingobium sp. B11D3D TaxID=2940576 RepID=UPI0022244DC9|nr:response regulator [Sphingobium sp. B11D3D]MCW2369982.1 CheY-like chemotaxis protein [Sphingobium sp. B11D3D]
MSPRPHAVLLVEDNPIIAMNTEALLEDLGITDVRVAANLAEALAFVNEVAFDFGLLDLKLGDEEDSLPVAARLADKGVPFAFATGAGDAMDGAERQNAVAILKKPYRLEDLRRVIEAQLGL